MALLLEEGESPEYLAMDVVAQLHRIYEQADDKPGLAGHAHGLRGLLQNLRTRSGVHDNPQAWTPVVFHSEVPPQETEESPRARLLEAVLLAAIVPGSEEGDEVARTVFTGFPEV